MKRATSHRWRTSITFAVACAAAVACGGEMIDSQDSTRATYAVSLPPGASSWSSCTSNQVGQLACETPSVSVASGSGWTCSAFSGTGSGAGGLGLEEISAVAVHHVTPADGSMLQCAKTFFLERVQERARLSRQAR